MNTYKQEIRDEICYTELAYGRINKKLGLELSKEKIEELISAIISETEESKFQKIGKNIYISNSEKNIKLTINSYTNRIITADKLTKNQSLNRNLLVVKDKIYDKINLQISDLNNETEGKEYDACNFKLNGMKIICRSSKITAKKVGQFVTFWKRDNKGITIPYEQTDQIDFYVINVKSGNNFGQFVFPKSELINKGIISTNNKDGKRGFRIYPKWDKADNKQATKTQKWQLNCFYEIDSSPNLKRVEELYSIK